MLLHKILFLKGKIENLEQGVHVVEGWLHDPVKSAKEYARDLIIGYITAYIAAVVVILGVLALLGFTSFLGGPYQPAQVLLYALLIVAICVGIILYRAWIKLKRLVYQIIENYKRSRARDSI